METLGKSCASSVRATRGFILTNSGQPLHKTIGLGNQILLATDSVSCLADKAIYQSKDNASDCCLVVGFFFFYFIYAGRRLFHTEDD